MLEEWRPVYGWPEYEVSSLGQVRRAAWAKYRGRQTGTPLRQSRARSGHMRVNLTARGLRWRAPVHQLVASAFLGERPTPLHETAHRDGDPASNAAANLRWATKAENEADRRIHGSRANKLTPIVVVAMREMATLGILPSKVAELFDVHEVTARDAMTGRRWKIVWSPSAQERATLIAAATRNGWSVAHGGYIGPDANRR